MTVLLVEPNVPLANVYRLGFEHAGYDVVVAHDAQSAVQAADEKRPDVVLLELQLAGHSGVEFLYEFQSYVDWQDIPVILNTLVPEKELPVQAGIFREYLYKPATTLGQLVDAVRALAPVAV